MLSHGLTSEPLYTSRLHQPPALAKGTTVGNHFKMGRSTEVAAAIIRRDDCVLVTRRAPGQKLEGFWEFPGGKLHLGETPQDCVVREVAEELTLGLRAGGIIMTSFYEYPGGAIDLIAVEAEIITGEITLSVHDAFLWALPSELATLQLAPADMPIARALDMCSAELKPTSASAVYDASNGT
jgi:8-oxo-dGTP diphosphatase